MSEDMGRNWPFPKLRDKTMKPTQDEINEYLLALRDSGAINMLGAGPYLEDVFGLTRYEAKDALLAWMRSMNARPQQ